MLIILSADIGKDSYRMRRKRMWRKLLILVGIVLVLYITHVINDWRIYQLEDELQEEFDYVNDVEVWDVGPCCTTVIFVPEDASFKSIEPIFIWMMKKYEDEEFINYLENRHDKKASGEMAFLQVSFYEEGTRDNRLYEFTSYKDFEVWELDGDKSVTYNISDYQ